MTLAEYVTRVMEEKNLTARAVERNSEGRITDSYVSKIKNGNVKRVSIPMLKALAAGLQVEESEVMAVAGISASTESPWPPETLLRAMQKIVASKGLTELVKIALDKKPDEIKKAIRLLKK